MPGAKIVDIIRNCNRLLNVGLFILFPSVNFPDKLCLIGKNSDLFRSRSDIIFNSKRIGYSRIQSA